MHLILLVGVKLEAGAHIQTLLHCFSFSELFFIFLIFYKANSLISIKILLQEGHQPSHSCYLLRAQKTLVVFTALMATSQPCSSTPGLGTTAQVLQTRATFESLKTPLHCLYLFQHIYCF